MVDNRACCHSSARAYALAQIGDHKPLALCFHCWNRHGPALFKIGAIVERLHVNDDCDTVVVRT